MNNRDRKPPSKSKNVDLFDNYKKPSKSKRLPNIIQLEKPSPVNNENLHIEEDNEGNIMNHNFMKIPECFKLVFDVKPDEVSVIEPRNIRIKREAEPRCDFDYTFYKRENYSDKEVDLLKSYLDNYNQHKYREFKKMLEGKSSARPVGNIFICGDIDVDKEIKNMRRERAKFVQNIKEPAKRSRLFRETNDSIHNNINSCIIINNNLRERQTDKTSSQSKKEYNILILIY